MTISKIFSMSHRHSKARTPFFPSLNLRMDYKFRIYMHLCLRKVFHGIFSFIISVIPRDDHFKDIFHVSPTFKGPNSILPEYIAECVSHIQNLHAFVPQKSLSRNLLPYHIDNTAGWPFWRCFPCLTDIQRSELHSSRVYIWKCFTYSESTCNCASEKFITESSPLSYR